MSNPIPGDDAERAAFEVWAIKYFGITKDDLIYRDGYDYPFHDAWEAFKAALAAPVSADVAADTIGAFAIDIEKMLCKALGRDWSVCGISIETLCNDVATLRARLAAGAPAETVKPMSYDDFFAEAGRLGCKLPGDMLLPPIAPASPAASGEAVEELCRKAERIDIHLDGMNSNEHYRERVFSQIIELDTAQGLKRFARLATSAAAQASTDAWQPIETAPQDGRTLLLGRFNALGNWRMMRGQWFTQAAIDSDWEEPDGFEAGWYETAEEPDAPNCWAISPTHWMPLPTAPAAPDTKGAAS